VEFILSGSKITINSDGSINVPNNPVIPFIEGDGIGPDIWAVTRKVVDAAVEKTYGDNRRIEWLEIYSGEKAFKKTEELASAGND